MVFLENGHFLVEFEVDEAGFKILIPSKYNYDD